MELINKVRESLQRTRGTFVSPIDGARRKILYCDQMATDLPLPEIEQYLEANVAPFHANIHSSSSFCARQCALYRSEARDLVRVAVRGSEDDAVIFCGAGATAAVNKLCRTLQRRCVKLAKKGEPAREMVVFVGPFEHHSNILPWRECGAIIVPIKSKGPSKVDLEHLNSALDENLHMHKDALLVGVFSLASNVTGVVADQNAITAALHRHGGIVVWDATAAAPHMDIDMHPIVPATEESCCPNGMCSVDNEEIKHLYDKDALFFSPHKFVGGAGTPGILVARKSFFDDVAPETPGGGSVFFVSRDSEIYRKEVEDREEAGSPDVVGEARCGLAMKLKKDIGTATIWNREQALLKHATEVLSKVPEIILFPDSEEGGEGRENSSSSGRVPLLSFVVWNRETRRFLHHDFVCSLLSDFFGIQVRAGCLCAAPYVWDLLGLDDEQVKGFEEALNRGKNSMEGLMERERDRLGVGVEVYRPGLVRVTLHWSLSDADLEFLLRAITLVATQGWRMLVDYEFDRDTGEWRHKLWRATSDKNRHWLGSFSMDTASSSSSSEDGSEKEGSPLTQEECLDVAERVMTAPRTNVHPPPPFFDEEQQHLKWFATPHDAGVYLQGNFEEKDRMPLFCKQRIIERFPELRSKEEEEEEKKGIATSRTSGEGDEEEEEGGFFGGDFGFDDDDDGNGEGSQAETKSKTKVRIYTPPRALKSDFMEAIEMFKMIREGDKILVCVSGGKDSLTMLHMIRNYQIACAHQENPLHFTYGAATVDPEDPTFNPEPLKDYMKALGVDYVLKSQPVIACARRVKPDSICSFCSRVKRGLLYQIAREGGYNAIALGQHLDDACESFIMSAFRNGLLRTMKANYLIEAGDLRVIRPLIFARERDIAQFAKESQFPIIWDNCPACFRAPTERHRIKQLLAAQEFIFPGLFPRK